MAKRSLDIVISAQNQTQAAFGETKQELGKLEKTFHSLNKITKKAFSLDLSAFTNPITLAISGIGMLMMVLRSLERSAAEARAEFAALQQSAKQFGQIAEKIDLAKNVEDRLAGLKEMTELLKERRQDLISQIPVGKVIDWKQFITGEWNPYKAKENEIASINKHLQQLNKLKLGSGEGLKPKEMEKTEQKISDLLYKRADLQAKLTLEGQVLDLRLLENKYAKEYEVAKDNVDLQREICLNWKTEEATINKEYADKAAAEERKQMEELAKKRWEFTRDLGEDIQRLMIETTKTGLAKELAEIDREEAEILEEARRLNADLDVVRLKYQIKRDIARRENVEQGMLTPERVSIAPLESHVLSRAPGMYEPYRELHKDNQDQLKNQDKQLQLSEQTKELIQRLVNKVESGEVVILGTANLNN